MPSSKSIDRSNEFTILIPRKKPTIPQIQTNNVVSRETWREQNYEHLSHIYGLLQDACKSSGRYVFDAQTCDFGTFCDVAYMNSYKYKKNDPNYDSNEEEEETCFEDDVVF